MIPITSISVFPGWRVAFSGIMLSAVLLCGIATVKFAHAQDRIITKEEVREILVGLSEDYASRPPVAWSALVEDGAGPIDDPDRKRRYPNADLGGVRAHRIHLRDLR